LFQIKMKRLDLSPKDIPLQTCNNIGNNQNAKIRF
jgi:hypothetical protein